MCFLSLRVDKRVLGSRGASLSCFLKAPIGYFALLNQEHRPQHPRGRPRSKLGCKEEHAGQGHRGSTKLHFCSTPTDAEAIVKMLQG